MERNNKLVLELEKNQRAIARLNKEIEQAVGAQLVRRDELEKHNADMREAIKVAMEENGVKKFDGDLISITYVAPSVRNTFDSKKFKEERPKTYEKYLKETKIKSSIRLKVKA